MRFQVATERIGEELVEIPGPTLLDEGACLRHEFLRQFSLDRGFHESVWTDSECCGEISGARASSVQVGTSQIWRATSTGPEALGINAPGMSVSSWAAYRKSPPDREDQPGKTSLDTLQEIPGWNHHPCCLTSCIPGRETDCPGQLRSALRSASAAER